ncbi:CLUMA_CG008898, isoform A [Clunio marinus]|uniref:CLUMA_CG008898, isoform A n=1 Tax=Clunio marinus TaxID=568069 RepID=A0A1J1I6T7_9DIPT|nr:CLUMA_CG008898, isoform A [Clunio marinus]
MRNCIILLLTYTVLIVFANDDLTLETESDELMKTGDLEHAETKDASATEIIKQIRKVNADGTYTIGFEADDGTFKIETRDLQGNVKQGTYGFVDKHGEVKRVSYSTENNTLYKEMKPSEQVKEDEKETINLAHSMRYNRTFASTTRRPSSLAYLTSPSSPTMKSSVIQNIPKRRILLPSERTTLRSQSDNSKQPFEGTTTVVYATSVPTPKPYSSRSTTSPNYSSKVTERNDKVEIDQVERKVYISTSKDSTTAKPEQLKEKNDEKMDLIKRGNSLRRQLKQDDDGFEVQQQIIYGDGDESSAIYGSGLGNVRPLFTTTTQPRIPLQLLAARQRATQLQNVLANSSPATTTEKTYIKAPKRQSSARVKVEDVTENLNENYLTQPPIHEHQTVESEASAVDERRQFQRPLPPQLESLYRPRNYLRQLQHQPVPQQTIQERRLPYKLPPNPPGPDLNELRSQISPAAQRFAQQYQQPQQGQTSGFSNQPAETFNSPSPLFPPRSAYDLDRPLTVRDFERLLQLLIFRQQQPYRINPYYPPSNPASYPPFIPGYNQPYSQIPRPPFYNPVTSGLFDPGYQNPYYSPSSPVSQQFPNGGGQSIPGMYQQVPQNSQQVLDPNYDIQRLVPRRRQYDPRLYNQQMQASTPPSEQEMNYNSLQSGSDNFLPPSVREQLLYRMLMLAIRNDQQYSPTSSAAASDLHTIIEPEQQEANTVATKSPSPSKKPVRSVQILGEEDEE